MISGVLEAFKSVVSPPDTRIQRLPKIVLVYGGPLGGAYDSGRQMFMNWMLAKGHPVCLFLRTPEQYGDWDKYEGYSNLIDFERDAGNLAQAIVLFSESPGAYAELGAFCMDSVLSERLFVVIDKNHYRDGSFIANGPIKKIELLHEDSICVVENIAPAEIEPELPDVAAALEEKINNIPKTHAFDPSRDRDQFLLVADLVELFGALTIMELHQLVQSMGVDIPKARLESIANQLKRFGLVELVQRTTKRYYVPPVERQWYLNYEAPAGAAPFDRARFKMQKAFPLLQKDGPRFKAYNEIHSKA